MANTNSYVIPETDETLESFGLTEEEVEKIIKEVEDGGWVSLDILKIAVAVEKLIISMGYKVDLEDIIDFLKALENKRKANEKVYSHTV